MRAANESEGKKTDMITELAGIDSRFRISVKYAAAEIIKQGSALYNFVLDRALRQDGLLALRCAEACARASREMREAAKSRSAEIADAVIAGPQEGFDYFLAEILIHCGVKGARAKKCYHIISRWLEEETEKGPKACFLEALYALTEKEKSLRPKIEREIEKALKSPVPSYSARARRILMKTKRRGL